MPIPNKPSRPAWVYGPKDGDQHALYQCPVSAIDEGIFGLLDLWWSCRLMSTLPVAGAFVDQPLSVRVAFPHFESCMRSIETQAALKSGAANAMTTALRRVFGGR